MSSQKGNVSRSRAQKHKNNTAFVNNKYGATVQVQKANSKIHDGLCKHCKGVLEWRVRYNKYKSLTQPKKCIKCAQRTVKDAYHILCKPCSLELDICCKCGKKEKIVIPINSEGDNNDEEEGEVKGEEKDEEKGGEEKDEEGEVKGEEIDEEGEVKGEEKDEKVVEQKKKVRVRAKKDLDDSDSDDDEEREDLHSGSKKTQNKSDDLPDVSRLRVRFND